MSPYKAGSLMDLHEVECRVMDWIELAKDDREQALVNALMSLRFP